MAFTNNTGRFIYTNENDDYIVVNPKHKKEKILYEVASPHLDFIESKHNFVLHEPHKVTRVLKRVEVVEDPEFVSIDMENDRNVVHVIHKAPNTEFLSVINFNFFFFINKIIKK